MTSVRNSLDCSLRTAVLIFDVGLQSKGLRLDHFQEGKTRLLELQSGLQSTPIQTPFLGPPPPVLPAIALLVVDHGQARYGPLEAVGALKKSEL